MPRTFNTMVCCPKCGCEHTAETDMERYLRNEPMLQSDLFYFARFDLDILCHRYKDVEDLKSKRVISCMMFVETKTHMAKCSPKQADTLHVLNQIMRNRRANIHQARQGSHAGDHTPAAQVHSLWHGRKVPGRFYGGHCLRLSGTCPQNSKLMLWDEKEISTLEQLALLLRMDLDPDDMRPINHKRRSQSFDPSVYPAVPLLRSAGVI